MDVIAPPHPGPFHGGNGPRSLPAVHKTKVQAIRTYAEALFPAPYLIGLLLELGAPPSGFRVLSEYITRRGDTYTARTGLLSHGPSPHGTNLTQRGSHSPLCLRCPPRRNVPTLHRRVAACPCGRGHSTCNPSRQCASLLTGPAPSPLWCLGTGILAPVGIWLQLSVGLLNHGEKACTPAFLWVIGMAVTGDKDMVALGQTWAEVLQVCSLHLRVHKLFIILRRHKLPTL